ncbi:carboxyltransferase domain-containing protein [Corynebacterium pacaense]|uniref:ATP-binding protein n=1 Tax=Corynebacterium pacaense TaxID=1816684 RepID=UPI0009B9D0D9|nr:carboxyltransferase domain-containing protein [Corynebacterium pacaense]
MSPQVQLRAVGSDAVLLDCGDLDSALEVLAALTVARQDGRLEVAELVPAAETVMIRGGEARDPRALSDKLPEVLAKGERVSSGAADTAATVVPVLYDGGDLAEVAGLLNMSIDQVIARHTGTDYTVAFTGFAPGFAYLSGGDPALNVPRRSTPRPRIDAGSVGLAGSFSGVYPRRSPGGWQLIGRTTSAMWDLSREQPALLTPGSKVRFVVERERVDLGAEARPRSQEAAVLPEVAGRPVLKVTEPGLQTLIQDHGRPGFAEMGVSAAGGADPRALDGANALVGNSSGAAVLELGMGAFTAEAIATTTLAITGAPRAGLIRGGADTREVPYATAFELEAGESITLEEPSRGRRSVLAIKGGVATELVLGSASRDTLAGLGPAPLEPGDNVLAGEMGVEKPASYVPTRGKLPVPGQTTVLRVIAGPRDDWFARPDATGSERLWRQDWTVSPSSDRVGVRLAGVPLVRAEEYSSRELPSEAMATGSLQVPPDGQPVIFLADHPLTGGYPVIGVVCEEDIELAAQLPSDAKVRFIPHTPVSGGTGHIGCEESPRVHTAESEKLMNPPKTITTVLIANRGEIGVRVARAAREAGLRSVAVYADADIDALHVRAADDAYALHGETPGDTYLNIDKLLEVARVSGADAVHPGYGFLSESSEFARAVIAAGLIWIGPNPDTIDLLGDKARARALAADVGAPLVPGTNEPVRDAEEIENFADTHGLPIAIKAVHGGGGRGIRMVHRREDIADAFESAVREAVTAFGQGDCLVERFLEHPRHIEAQVLGDSQGRIAVLGTRDCSLQRRNQKLVEEAPAPYISDEIRERIHQAAADICGAAGYVGAATVEFLLGSDNTLSFLEVNTRLQVEHPVTEEVTGIDLVQEQFTIAAGLPMTVPEEVPQYGHAIEFRINAEDPALGYLPTPGLLERFDAPSGQGVRLDAGYEAGQTIPGTFDSLIAKLVIWGRDREQALARARRALGEFHIEGVATVLPFDRFVVGDPAFTATGGAGFAVHTRWIEEECSADFPVPAEISVGQSAITRLPIEIDGRRATIGLPLALLSQLTPVGNVGTASELASSSDPVSTGPGAVLAPFAGTLRTWKVEDGTVVEEGDTVAVLEAMKMEVPVKAPRGGTLRHGLASGENATAGQSIGEVEK